MRGEPARAPDRARARRARPASADLPLAVVVAPAPMTEAKLLGNTRLSVVSREARRSASCPVRPWRRRGPVQVISPFASSGRTRFETSLHALPRWGLRSGPRSRSVWKATRCAASCELDDLRGRRLDRRDRMRPPCMRLTRRRRRSSTARRSSRRGSPA